MTTYPRATALLVVLWVIAIAGCDNLPFTNPSQQPLPNDQLVGGLHRDASLFVFSYDKAFAQRFSMPMDKAIALNPGLKAIAIELRPEIGQIDCYLHLYLDESVKLFMPANRVDYTRQQEVERVFAYDFTKEDSEWRGSFSNRVIYRAKSAGLRLPGFKTTQGYEQYKENFLPRLNLVTLDMFCTELDNIDGPSEVILQKADTGDYLLGHDEIKEVYKNAYHFDIPPKLRQHLQQKYANYVRDFNDLENSRLNSPHRDPTVEIP